MKKILLVLVALMSINTFSQEIEFGKVSKKEVEEKFYPLDSTANAAYLYRSRRTFYEFNPNSGFGIVNEFHLRIKIYNKEGFKKANKTIVYYTPKKGKKEKISSLKGYSFNIIDGKIKKQKLSKSSIFEEQTSKFRSVKKITFPNIKEGTVIDLKYKLISPYMTSIDEVEFQYDIPVKQLSCKIEIPEFFIFKEKSKGYYSITPKKSTKPDSYEISSISRNSNRNNASGSYSSFNNTKVNYTKTVNYYSASNIPAIKNNEPFVSSIKNYRGGVKFELKQTNFLKFDGKLKNYTNTWGIVSRQVYKSQNFGGELKKTNYFKKDLPNIIKDATNDIEKTIAIFQFVKSKVKWNSYYGKYSDVGVKKAYKSGVGNVADINLMLTSMLREAGLNANPVLVSTRKNGIPLFPTLDGFNYVISVVDLPNNKYVLLDATEQYSTPNTLPVRVLNWNGRKITKDGQSSWVKLTSNKPALEENIISVKLTKEGSVNGLLRTKHNNLNALNFRNTYNHIKEEALISKLEEKHNIEIEDYRLLNKKNISKPISQIAKFSSEDLVEEINGKLYINSLLFLTQKENPFKSEERKFPVDFSSPWKDINTISIQIPEGFKVETTPENLAIGLPDNLGSFKFQITPAGNKIKVQSILQFNSSIISPEYYPVLKEFYGKVVDKQLEKIVLSK